MTANKVMELSLLIEYANRLTTSELFDDSFAEENLIHLKNCFYRLTVEYEKQ